MTLGEKITTLDMALAEGRPFAESARLAQLTPPEVAEVLRDPKFPDRVRQARRTLVGTFRQKLELIGPKALEQLERYSADPGFPPELRLRATEVLVKAHLSIFGPLERQAPELTPPAPSEAVVIDGEEEVPPIDGSVPTRMLIETWRACRAKKQPLRFSGKTKNGSSTESAGSEETSPTSSVRPAS